jgi:hypothetical protein
VPVTHEELIVEKRPPQGIIITLCRKVFFFFFSSLSKPVFLLALLVRLLSFLSILLIYPLVAVLLWFSHHYIR